MFRSVCEYVYVRVYLQKLVLHNKCTETHTQTILFKDTSRKPKNLCSNYTTDAMKVENGQSSSEVVVKLPPAPPPPHACPHSSIVFVLNMPIYDTTTWPPHAFATLTWGYVQVVINELHAVAVFICIRDVLNETFSVKCDRRKVNVVMVDGAGGSGWGLLVVVLKIYKEAF